MDQRTEQLQRDSRDALRIDRERVELFEMLIQTPGWKAYVALLEARLQILADEMLAPAKSIDGMIALEYVKGTMSGLVFARDIPNATIAGKDQLRSQPVTEEFDDSDS